MLENINSETGLENDEMIKSGAELVVDINTDIPRAFVEYIIDCWYDFKSSDLGMKEYELPMVLSE